MKPSYKIPTNFGKLQLPKIELIGKQVILRPLQAADMIRIIRWLFEREIRRYFVPILNADGRSWLISLWTRNDTLIYSITTPYNGKLLHVGNIGIQNLNMSSKTAEIGIALGCEKYRNQHFGQESIRLFTNFLVNDLRLECIDARIIASNTRSIHVFEKLGYNLVSMQKEIKTHAGMEQLLLYKYVNHHT